MENTKERHVYVTIVWKEFPELKREVDLVSLWTVVLTKLEAGANLEKSRSGLVNSDGGATLLLSNFWQHLTM